MLTVCARSPPVPTMSTRRPGHVDPDGVLAASRRPGRRARRPSRPWRAARPGSPRPAPASASPTMIWSIAQAVSARSGRWPASRVASSAGQRRLGGCAGRADRAGAAASAAPAAARAVGDGLGDGRPGRAGAARPASARDQVASQASCGRPVSTRIGGQRKISSLSWRHMPMPADGHRLAVEDEHVEPAGVDRGDHGRLGGALGPPTAGRSARGPPPTASRTSRGRPSRRCRAAPSARLAAAGVGPRGRGRARPCGVVRVVRTGLVAASGVVDRRPAAAVSRRWYRARLDGGQARAARVAATPSADGPGVGQ